MSADRFDEMVRPFAVGIFALSAARADESLTLTRFQDARIREAISTLIRKACDVVYPAVRVPEVSAAADAAAKQLGIDLQQETWHSQKKFDPGYKVFHYEHMQPVGIILAAAAAAGSVDTVVAVLRRELRLTWITKDEDKALNALGFASKRPNPDEAYTAAGIELLPRDEAHVSAETAGEPRVSTSPPTSDSATNPTEHDPGSGQAPLPPTVTRSASVPANEPHESGFRPVDVGDAFQTAQIGLCLGGQVQLYTDAGGSLWSIGQDSTLFDAQCRAYLARTTHDGRGYREAGLFNPSTGTLLLQPRFPKASNASEADGTHSFDVTPIQLAPPAAPSEAWSDDLQTLLARAVQHTIGDGGQVRVETGGWDSAPTPSCSIELALGEDRTPILYLETSPVPHRSRWWKDRMRPVGPDAARLMLRAEDFNPDQAALLLRDALDWEDVSPWDLVLTYTRPPQSSTIVG